MLDASSDPATLREADAVIVCVPTPLNKTREPDMRFILAATEEDRSPSARRHARDPRVDDLPGNNDGSVVPKLTEKGAVLGADGIHRIFSRARRSG